MPTVEARVETARASRYLVQLCRHASTMGGASGGRLRAHVGADSQADRPADLDAQWSDTEGVINLGGGRCTLEATANALVVRIDAPDEAVLRRIRDAVTRNLTRFGRRDHLAVAWRRSEPHAADSSKPASTTHRSGPAETTRASGRHRQKIILGAAVLLAVAAHLAVGGAVLAVPRWLGWAADAVLAVVLLKVVAVAGHVVLGRVVIGRSTVAKGRDGGPSRLSVWGRYLAAAPRPRRSGSRGLQ